jgi:glutamate dehydrogenase/leucine dehydrogenase
VGLDQESGIVFVPDALVSPGGVISVSHELAMKWEADAVNDDSMKIVGRSVRQVFKTAEERFGGIGPVQMYQAFQVMT